MEVFDLSKVRKGFSDTSKGVGFDDPAMNLTVDVCRWGYQPTWADDKPSPAVIEEYVVKGKPVELKSVAEMTAPPKKKGRHYA